MREHHTTARLALGALAGLLGTLVLQSSRSAAQKLWPKADAPIKQDPGKFMVHQAEKVVNLPGPTAEAAVSQVLGLGYGMSFGTFYASLHPRNTRPEPTLRDGMVLGLVTWAAGYLGWLPATGLMSPVWKHRPKQFWPPLAEHAIYGIVTAASYQWLAHRAEVIQ